MRRREAIVDTPLGLEPMQGDLRAEPTRIGNPFARFRTRSYWLSAIIRRSREIEAERTKPDWFNR